MTWRPALGPGLASPPLPPRVICDGCGLTRSALTQRGDLCMWAMHRKAPPGWLLVRRDEADGSVYRRDYCPECRREQPLPGAAGEPREG